MSDNSRYKFRAWDKQTKEMIVDHLSWGLELNSGFSNPCSTWIMMQSTGLKDKHGKLIFEGDIVCGIGDYETALSTVEWVVYGWKTINHNLVPLSIGDKLEVLGNVHENPNLLNDEGEE